MSDTTSPARASKRFAFLVHPRADVATDMGRVWRPLGHIPSAAWDWGLRRLPVPPQLLATVRRRDAEPTPARTAGCSWFPWAPASCSARTAGGWSASWSSRSTGPRS